MPVLQATRVASIKGRRDELGPELELVAAEGWIYVGRACTQGRWRLKTSPFHNPYSAAEFGAVGCVEQFRVYLRRSPALVAEIRKQLRGKVLCCWCKPARGTRPGDPCHAPVLAEVADGADP